jgi:3-oxoacyl-[acyl-carrier-protein] synthase III
MWVAEANRDRHDKRQLEEFERRIYGFLHAGGAETRYIRADGERAVDLMDSAIRQAMERAAVEPDDIEFIIYVGVGRGWIEPSMACLIQLNHGFRRASGFDVVEACASWLRGVQVAHSFLKSGAYKTGIIVNCECNSHEYLTLEVDDEADLERHLASFTVGEAATATVVTSDDVSKNGGGGECDDDFYFSFSTFSEHLELSMIPFSNADEYLPPESPMLDSANQFITDSRKLVRVALEKSVQAFRDDARLMSSAYDLILSHSLGRACLHVGRKLKLPLDKYFDISPRFGNTVSASIPLGIAVARDEGRLNRGDHLLALVPSAGFTVGFASFTY